MKSHILYLMMAVLLVVIGAGAQQSATGSGSATVVPQLINFSGVAKALNGQPMTGMVGITFALYQEQQGGAPLWLETQNVQLDAHGNYTVQLGGTLANGLPEQLFSSGEARWVGVQISGQEEQPRVMLLSVPYAMKAVDAQTVGGLPATAFVLAAPPTAPGGTSSPGVATGSGAVQPSLSGSGTADYIPLWTNSSTLGNSVLYQSGTGSKAKVGINTTTPASTLDVKGAATVRGLFALPAAGTATATAGYDSQPIKLTASAFNSSSATAIAQNFQWQAQPTGNDTSSPSGTLNLLFAQGTNKLAETGLNIASTGLITFAGGQTFPGTATLGANTFNGNQGINGNVAINATGTTLTAAGGTTGLFGSGSTYGVQGSSSGLGVYGDSASGTGVFGSSSSGNGVYGGSTSGDGVFGSSSSSTGVFGDGVYGVFGSGSSDGVIGESSYGYGVEGSSSSSYGVYASSGGTAAGTTGVLGWASASSSNQLYGVFGNNSGSNYGAGVYGQDATTGVRSNTGSSWIGGGAGVWGDGGTSGNAGVIATADDYNAAMIENNSSGYFTLHVYNLSSSGYPFNAYNSSNNGCYIDPSGHMICTGSQNAIVPIDGGRRKVALSAIESPKNWFEDFGSAQLSNGSAVVAIEPEYQQTVNTELEYHVFLTPDGDCKGLYVSHRTPTSFEVRELGGGTSSIEFSYRILALRKNFENIRMADHTNDPDPMKTMAKTGTPFRFDSSKMKLPERPAPMPRPAVQTGKPTQAPK